MLIRLFFAVAAFILLAPLCAQAPVEQPKTARKAAPSSVKFADEGEAGLRVVEGSVSTLGTEQPLKNFRLLVLAKLEDGASESKDLDSDANARYRIELGKKVAQLRVFAYGDFVIPDSWSNVAIASMKFAQAENWDLKVRPNVNVTLKGAIKLAAGGKAVDNGCAVFLAPLNVRQDGSMRVFDEPLPTRCDADGNYEFKTPAGFYRLWAVWTDRTDGRWVYCSGIVQRVDLFADTIKDFSIAPGPQITGRVIDARDGKPVVSRIDFYTNAFLRQLNNVTSDGEFRDDEAVEGDPVLPAGQFRFRLVNIDAGEFAAIIRPRQTEGVMHVQRGLSHAALKGKPVEWSLFGQDDIWLELGVQTAEMKLPVLGTDVLIQANRLDDPEITHLRAAFELRAITDEHGIARFVGLAAGDYSVYIERGTVLLGKVKVSAEKRQKITMDYALPFAAGSVRYPDGSMCNTAMCEVELELPEGGRRGPFFPDPFVNRVLREKGLALIPLTLKGATFKLRFFANANNQPAPDQWTPSQFPWRSQQIAFKVDAEKAYKFEVTLERAADVPEPKPEAGPMRQGEFWYRMEDDKGKAQGYARMVVKTHDDGQNIEWEMKLAYTGGSYEEERALAVDKQRGFVRSSYSADGKLVCEGERSEGKVRGTRTKDGKQQPFEIATPDDALPYMGFMLAATMPLAEGETWTRRELDEANAFADKGEMKFEMHKDTITWDGKELACWRVDVTKPNDEKRKLTLWVSNAREIVRVNWGNLVQVLSMQSTKHLFKKPEPAMKETNASTKEWLELEAEFEGATPEKLYDYFTKPELLTKWWPPEAEIEMKVGGKYRAIWKQQNWILEGTVKEFEEGKKFVFTWRWNETPAESPTLEVHCTFEKTEKGARMVIRHGPNATDEKGQESRAGYIAGWQQFIAALKEAVKK
jgi:uncharacterized protein YndB with AHSA1/START domain